MSEVTLPSPPQHGWLLYDDFCGICRRWILFLAPALRRRGYEVVPLQASWVRDRLELSKVPLLQDLRLLLTDGMEVQGAEVYRHLMRRIWWAYPVYLLTCLPVLREIFDFGYRTFARNRFRFSKACGLAVRPGQVLE